MRYTKLFFQTNELQLKTCAGSVRKGSDTDRVQTLTQYRHEISSGKHLDGKGKPVKIQVRFFILPNVIYII